MLIYAFKTQEALAVKFKMVESLFPLFFSTFRERDVPH